MDLINLEIKLACREPGCPICRLRIKAERRYLFNFLWENVNDAGVRQKLVKSLGFCYAHAWQLQDMEATRWRDGMGTAIVYGDLARRTLHELEALRQKLPSAPVKPSPRNRALTWILELPRRLSPARNRGGQALPTGLVPRATCRVCEIGARAAKRYTLWLVHDCTEEAKLREAYVESEGLCLPHLRPAVKLAAAANPAAAHFLVDATIARLQTLTTDLGEYVRKHDYQYRHERMSLGEREAWIRAVAWFTGEKRILESQLQNPEKEEQGNR